MEVDDENELEIDEWDDVEVEGESDGENSEPSWSPSLFVNGVTYAVSLFWQPLQDTSDPYPEVNETIENIMEGADLFCLRTGMSPQYGIGNSKEGHKVGMPSAAAGLAEAFQDKPSSVAVFEVDEGWWFIAVRNDLILSEEDILYENEEDAKRAFFAMMAVPDWGRRIAPAAWGIEGTEEIFIEDVLTHSNSSKLMHSDKSAQQKTKIIIGVVAFIVLVLVYKLFSGLFKTDAPVIRPLAPIKPLFEEKKVEEVVEVRPWETLVVVEDLLNRCQIATQQVKLMVIPGWKLGKVSCTRSGLSTSWMMEWGHLGWIKRGFEEYNLRGLSFLLDEVGRSALVSVPIGAPRIHSQTPKYMIYESREELNDFFQAIGQPVTLSEEKTETLVQVSKDGLARKTTSEEKKYARTLFTFTSDLSMEQWLDFFNRFPALEITKLDYDINNNSWTYEGHIYEPML